MTPSQRHDVLKMKRAGYSGREIANTIKVPQTAVAKYLKEKGYGRPARSKPDKYNQEIKEAMRAMNRPYKRCRQCGGMVQHPCLYCQLTAQRKPATAANN